MHLIISDYNVNGLYARK